VNTLSNYFTNCISLTDVNDISSWNNENVSDMSSLFRGCKSLENLSELCNWKTSNVVNMSLLFYECENLRTPWVEVDKLNRIIFLILKII
jgi:surface protein